MLREQIHNLLPKKCEVKLFYFAVPPSLFESLIENVVAADMHGAGDGIESRLLIEKPFGHDLASAQHLHKTITDHFGKESVYPIDHYLAKDTAQNIHYFRFKNPLMRGIWDSSDIAEIQVSALEMLDIQGRIKFYEHTGALRDMIQGHMLQILALVTMDELSSLEADDVRRQRQLMLKSIAPIRPEDVHDVAVRGQYDGYRTQVENPESNTETFAALKLNVDNSRWRGVPIYVRAGKAMETKVTEINIVFRSKDDALGGEDVLTFRLQPGEGVAITLTSKKPGLENKPEVITLDYCYNEHDEVLANAYERILHDALEGDQTIFPTDEEIMASWTVVQPVLDAWQANGDDLSIYAEASRNVLSADALVQRHGSSGWIFHESWVCTPRFTPPTKN